MSMTDPLADMFTRIRNGSKAKFEKVDIPSSKIKREVAKILKEEGFIKNFKMVTDEDQHEKLRVFLKYDASRKEVIRIRRISRPGRRIRRIRMTSLRLASYLRKTRSFSCWSSSVTILKFFINPSSFKIFATSLLILEEGMSTFSNLAFDPFRIRVNISAKGSVIDILPSHQSPAGFDHSGYFSPGGILSQAEPAHIKFSIISSGPSTKRASMVLAHLKFLRPLCFDH